MVRPLRIEYEGAFYHVTARGNERRKIFLSDSDFTRFLSKQSDAIQKYETRLHAYVLMSNHYHLIVETPRANLSAFMQTLNSSYTTYFNIKRKRAGHLFQGRYKAILIEADNYLLELSRYIHLNPVRAGIVKDPADYSYSSFRSYTGREKDDRIYREKIWEMISRNARSAPERYAQFVRAGMEEEQANPVKRPYGGMMLGSKSFIKNALEQARSDALQNHEISNRRAFHRASSIEEVVHILADYFQVRDEEIISKRNYKSYAVYLARKFTQGTNAEIGKRFGISYSAVTKAGTRMRQKLEKDKGLSRILGKIEGQLSRVKG